MRYLSNYDLISTSVSLLSTFLCVRMNSKAWPVGIFATFLNGWLYWTKGIYAGMFLQGFYFITSFFGWYLWTNNKGKKKTLRVLTKTQWLVIIGCVSAGSYVVYNLLQIYTHSSIALIDALTTILSLTAQSLMCYKVLTSWIIWFIVNILYTFLYIQKGLPYHTLLMFVYLGMAISGYVSWSRENNLNLFQQPKL